MILRNYLQHYRYRKFKKKYQTILVVEKFDLSPTPSWGTEKVHIEQGFVVVVPPGGRKGFVLVSAFDVNPPGGREKCTEDNVLIC